MSYLWAGAEDIDFPNGSSITSSTSTSNFRTGYGRCGIRNTSASVAKSTLFPGGAVTDCWLTFWFNTNTSYAPNQCILLGKSGTSSGVGVGSNSNKITLVTYNGSTATTLATEVGSSLSSGIVKVDLQVISFGSSGTLNLFVNGAPVLTYTGNLTIGGTISSLDSVFLQSQTFGWFVSEIVVATSDTRSFSGLVTMAPNGNGTTQAWSNAAFTNFNPVTINDANSTFTNTTGQDEQATLVDLPSGNFSVPMVKIAARALATTGATATNLEMGVNDGGTVAVGSPHALTTAFSTYEDYLTANPVTSSAWLQSSMNGLQVDLRSA